MNQSSPALLGCGAGALAWAKVRRGALCDSAVGRQLQEAYRLHSLQSALHLKEIDYVVGALNRGGVDTGLVKGWAAARLYYEMGLRPYGDLDLCFRPEQYRAAVQVISELDPSRFNVDLHDGFSKLDSLSPDELFGRSRQIKTGNATFNILSDEDHLRILCTHSLRHGLWRPLWLCDIAAAVESRGSDFDWQRCLGNGREADWVRCTIVLAHELLGARIDDTPLQPRAGGLPRWLVSRVLKNWSRPYPLLYPPQSYTRPLATYLRNPRGLLRTLSVRWTDPIEASIRMNAPFNEVPRFPFQVCYAALRLGRFVGALPRSLGGIER